jgi:hypothetical protein
MAARNLTFDVESTVKRALRYGATRNRYEIFLARVACGYDADAHNSVEWHRAKSSFQGTKRDKLRFQTTYQERLRQPSTCATTQPARKPANVDPRRISHPLPVGRSATSQVGRLSIAGRTRNSQHFRGSRLLLSMVAGYLLSMLGGILLLHALSPTTHDTTHATEAVYGTMGSR